MPSIDPAYTFTGLLDGHCVALHLTCTGCGHIRRRSMRETAALAAERGWGDRIDDTTPHLRCAKCGARDPEARGDRGWG